MTTSVPPGPEPGWTQVPPLLVAEAAWVSPAAFMLSVLGPVIGLARDGVGPGPVLTTAAAALLGAMWARSGARSAGASLTVGVGLMAVAALGGTDDPGPWRTLVTLAAVAGAWWWAGRSSTGTAAARARRSRPVAALAIAIAGLLAAAGAPTSALVAAAAALAVALTAALPVPERWLATLDRPVEVVSRAMGVVATIPALGLVTVRWTVDRLVGHDPLRAGRAPGWSSPPREVAPTRLSAAAPVVSGWRARLSAAVVLALTAAVVVPWALRPGSVPTPAAVAGDPDWPAIHAESTDLTRRLRLDPVTVFRLPDYRGDHVNQSDGRRRTWRPPACDCRRFRVWWFGGSAAWGMYQRDGESVPSEVARAAWAKGVALDIENRAVPGFVIDQEVRAIEAALELTSDEDLPDLILVMDGANDATLQVDRNEDGRGDDRSGGPDIDRSLGGLSRLADLWADLRRDRGAGRIEEAPARRSPRRSPAVLADHVAARFRANIGTAEAVTSARGVEVAFLWQPTVASTPIGTGDPTVTGGDSWAEVMRRVPGELGDQVLDLSGALRSLEEPVFIDEVHISERGAEVLGGAIASRVLPLLPADDTR